jgi:Flp pilus assembly protein TadG
MKRALLKLRDCERGASLIEMALVSPFLAALVLGAVDLSRAYSDRLQLEQAAQRTIEKVEQQRTVATDYSSLADEAATAAGITKTSSNPSVGQWLECSSDGGSTWTSQGANSISSQCPNGTDLPARYVTIQIQKNFTPLVRTRYLGSNADGTYTLTAQAGIRVQ